MVCFSLVINKNMSIAKCKGHNYGEGTTAIIVGEKTSGFKKVV